METLIIGQAEIIQLLPMKQCIDVMEDAFRRLAKDEALIHPRTGMALAENKLLGMMPSYLPGLGKAGLKVTTVYPGNSGTRYHVHQGVVLLFEAGNGSLQAILDAAETTTIRTGAASGLATKLLANPWAGDLAIIGAGTQGSCHLEAMRLVRQIHRVRVYDYFSRRAEEFAQRESLKHGINIEAVSRVEDAVTGADLICIATPAREPVLKGDWVAPGAHINSVGYGGREARELDTPLLLRSRLFVDHKETILHDCGDLLVPLQAGEISEGDIQGSLADLLSGRVESRQSQKDITLFKSAGVAVQDLAAADYIYRQALKQGIGTGVKLCGFNNLFKESES